MAIIPLNVARVSQHLRSFQLQQSLTGRQLDLLRIENQLSTGLRFLTPSQAPADAAVATSVERRLDSISGVMNNLRTANSTLSATESAMLEAVELMRSAHNTALEALNSSTSAEERASLANYIDSIVGQAVSVANRRHVDTYLFSGHYGGGAPFEFTGDSVLYRGDLNRLSTLVDSDLTSDTFTVPGGSFFGAVSGQVRGRVDLNPAVTVNTRISDLRGSAGSGVRLGSVLVSNGTQQAEIDLSGAATVGDIVDRLNASMPPNLAASVIPSGIQVITTTGFASVTISDIGGGQAARDLGLISSGAISAGGTDLDPVLNLQTQLASLSGGAGLSLGGDIVIRNGNRSASVPVNGATTIEDVINRINAAGIGVWARINEDGRSIDVLNRTSGSDLHVEDTGGASALALGIRTTHGQVPLSELNDGRGVQTLPGDDLRIITAGGTTIDVDIDGATTLQDVIDRLNAAGGGAITVGIGPNGGGLLISDNTTGGGTIRIERLNLSPAIDGLGLNVTPTGNQLVGEPVRPVRVNSTFTALLELRDGLRGDDTKRIQYAGERLQSVMESMLSVQGQLAAQSKAMSDRVARLENEETATRVLLSDVRDMDLTEAVVRFQQVQTALQANITAAARVQNLSLMDAL